MVGLGSEPCNFGSSDESRISCSRIGCSLVSASDRHDRYAPHTGEVSRANRLRFLRDGMGRVLPLAYRTIGDIAAARGGAVLLAAHLFAVGRGRVSAVDGQSVLASFFCDKTFCQNHFPLVTLSLTR